MRRSSALGLFIICLVILGASTFVLLKKTNSPAPAMQTESQFVRQSLDQASQSLNRLQKFKLVLPPSTSPQALALQAQQQQEMTKLQDEIASLQAQLANDQNTKSDGMLTETIAVLGAIGGLIGSIATLITALRGPVHA